MKTKIPCGGFYLDDSLMLNEDNSLGVAGTHDSLTVKFRPNDAPDAGSDEYLCDTPLEKILEAVFKRKIPVNGLVFKNESLVCYMSLNYVDDEESEVSFSSPANILQENINDGVHTINKISFDFLTSTSRIFGGGHIYKMHQATINVGGPDNLPS